VPLFLAADVLGIQALFERIVKYFQQEMPEGGLTFFLSCVAVETWPPPLEKVATAAREAVLLGFEQFLIMAEELLLELPYDALLGLLREDNLAVHSEAALATFVLQYGKHHGLLGEAAPGGRWWKLCSALRWSQIDIDMCQRGLPSRDHGGLNFAIKSALELFSFGGDFPKEMVQVGAMINRARHTSRLLGDNTKELLASLQIDSLVLQPRSRVSPGHTPPLKPHQVEIFI